jgi:hypothetical protein
MSIETKEVKKVEKDVLNYCASPLLKTENGVVSGPMSPVLFAKDVAKELGSGMRGLCRVSFNEDPTVNQVYEGDRNSRYLTGHDTLVLAFGMGENRTYGMFVDEGVQGVPAFLFDPCLPDTIDCTPTYSGQRYERHLTLNEAIQIMSEIHKNRLCDPVGEKENS